MVIEEETKDEIETLWEKVDGLGMRITELETKMKNIRTYIREKFKD